MFIYLSIYYYDDNISAIRHKYGFSEKIWEILPHCKDTIKKKVKHDLKFLFSLFKKVSSVDDDNFLALFFVHFSSFWGTLSLYPTSTLCFMGVFPNSNI